MELRSVKLDKIGIHAMGITCRSGISGGMPKENPICFGYSKKQKQKVVTKIHKFSPIEAEIVTNLKFLVETRAKDSEPQVLLEREKRMSLMLNDIQKLSRNFFRRSKIVRFELRPADAVFPGSIKIYFLGDNRNHFSINLVNASPEKFMNREVGGPRIEIPTPGVFQLVTYSSVVQKKNSLTLPGEYQALDQQIVTLNDKNLKHLQALIKLKTQRKKRLKILGCIMPIVSFIAGVIAAKLIRKNNQSVAD